MSAYLPCFIATDCSLYCILVHFHLHRLVNFTSASLPFLHPKSDVNYVNLCWLLSGLTVYCGALLLAYGGVRACGRLHQRLLTRVMLLPMSFHDTTPTGRLMNRFSKDTDLTDIRIPILTEYWIKCVFHLIESLFVIAYSTPMFLAGATPLGISYFLTQVTFNKECLPVLIFHKSFYVFPSSLHFNRNEWSTPINTSCNWAVVYMIT